MSSIDLRHLFVPGMAQRVGRGIALLFNDCGTSVGEWLTPRPSRSLPPGKSRYPFYMRLGGSSLVEISTLMAFVLCTRWVFCAVD